MAYSDLARAWRRCTSTTRSGEPCRAWAVWGRRRLHVLRHGRRVLLSRTALERLLAEGELQGVMHPVVDNSGGAVDSP